MTLTVLRRCSAVIALFGALALVAACSGTSASGSLSPTGPSASLRSSSDDVVFTPNPDPPPPPEEPCVTLEAAVRTTGDPIGWGRFTGGFVFKTGDLKVTGGFTLHCDAILSNNFEVNWKDANGDAHHFHIDKNPTTVECRFIADPNPPDAPVNRIAVFGPGTLDGVHGALATVVLVDYGERAGAPPDQAFIEVQGFGALTGGSYGSPVPIDGGNIQAHFDQPHKN